MLPAKISKNKQIDLEECQNIYQRMTFTWVWQQSQKVNNLSGDQVSAKPAGLQDENII